MFPLVCLMAARDAIRNTVVHWRHCFSTLHRSATPATRMFRAICFVLERKTPGTHAKAFGAETECNAVRAVIQANGTQIGPEDATGKKAPHAANLDSNVI